MAVGNSILTIVWHLLSDPEARFHDLGADYYETRINAERRARNLATALEAVTGQRIIIRDSKAIVIDPTLPDPPPDHTRLRCATPGAFGLPTHLWIFGSVPDDAGGAVQLHGQGPADCWVTSGGRTATGPPLR